MKKFKDFINESSTESTTGWINHTNLLDHIHKKALSKLVSHDYHKSIENHNILHNGNIFYRHNKDEFGRHSVDVASNAKDNEGTTHHATFHLSPSNQNISHAELKNTKKTNNGNETKRIRSHGYEGDK